MFLKGSVDSYFGLNNYILGYQNLKVLGKELVYFLPFFV